MKFKVKELERTTRHQNGQKYQAPKSQRQIITLATVKTENLIFLATVKKHQCGVAILFCFFW
jgi:hypothetical protein